MHLIIIFPLLGFPALVLVGLLMALVLLKGNGRTRTPVRIKLTHTLAALFIPSTIVGAFLLIPSYTKPDSDLYFLYLGVIAAPVIAIRLLISFNALGEINTPSRRREPLRWTWIGFDAFVVLAVVLSVLSETMSPLPGPRSILNPFYLLELLLFVPLIPGGLLGWMFIFSDSGPGEHRFLFSFPFNALYFGAVGALLGFFRGGISFKPRTPEDAPDMEDIECSADSP